MHYFSAMRRVLGLQGEVFNEIARQNRLLTYCVINVALLGCIYGGASIYFSQIVLARSESVHVGFNPLLVFMVGLSFAFLMHGGAALFIYVFCRGMGGRVTFMPPYLTIGVAAISLWPLAPMVSAMQAGMGGAILQVAAIAAALYALAACYIAVYRVSGLSHAKMAIAVSIAIIYAGCFLYLWT